MGKTKKGCALLLCSAFCVGLGAGGIFIAARAEEETGGESGNVKSVSATYGEIAAGIYDGEGIGAYDLGYASVEIKLGLFDVGTENFNLKSLDVKTPPAEGAERPADGNNWFSSSQVSGTAVGECQWTFASGSSVVLSVLAKDEGKIEVDGSAGIDGLFNDGSMCAMYVYRAESSEVERIYYVDENGDAVKQRLGGKEEVSVSAGDILYYEVGMLESESSDAGNVQKVSDVRISVSRIEKAVTGTYDMKSVVEGIAAAELKPMACEYANISAKIGLFDRNAEGFGLRDFDTAAINADKRMNLSKTGLDGLNMDTWKWEFAPESSVVVVVEAKYDGEIAFCMNGTFNGWLDWNSMCGAYLYKNEDKTLKEIYYIKEDGATGVRDKIVEGLNVEVSAGDILYYEVGTLKPGATGGRNIQNMDKLNIVVTTGIEKTIDDYKKAVEDHVKGLAASDYTEEDFSLIDTAAKAFTAVEYGNREECFIAYITTMSEIGNVINKKSVNEYSAKMKALVKEKNPEAYKAENWAKITAFSEGFQNGEYASVQELAIAFTVAKYNIEQVEDDPLAVARIKAKTDIENHYKTFSEKDYIEENWTLLTKLYTDCLTEIDEKTTAEEIEECYRTAAAAMSGIVKAKETLGYPNKFVTASVVSEGKEVEYSLVKVWACYGSVENKEFNPFTTFAGDGTGSPADKLSAENEKYMLERWQLRCDTQETIIRFVAKYDSTFTFTHPAGGDVWATHSGFRVVVENENGTQMVISDKKVVNNAAANTYLPESVTMKAGDTLYIVYYSTSGSATTDFNPTLVVDTSVYDESKRAEFETMEGLFAVKEEAYAELDEYVAALNKDDYSITRYSQIEDILKEAKETIKGLMTEEEIAVAVAEAKPKIDDVPTKAEEAAELNEHKATIIAELNNYAKQSDYTAENWKQIETIVAEYTQKINGATTKTAANTALAAAKGAINKIEKNTAGVNSGCGSILLPAMLPSLGIIAAAVFLKKKEH